MTRKKFVKKLMAEGLSRNESNKVSIKSRDYGIPYQEYYKYECLWLRVSNAMKKTGDSFKNVGEAINYFANSTMMSFAEAMYVATQND